MAAVNNELETAAKKLNNGEVVGLPTETVYGLAARIDLPSAIEKIFTTKERPFFDPLIVHVSSVAQATTVTSHFGKAAETLAKAFWPGPLTMILPRSLKVNSMITSGLDSVGIRMPKHSLALQLIEKVGVPLAAPSANKFGRTSPTSAAHVKSEFKDKDVFVIDGGDCEIGIESTVLLIREREDKTLLSILRKGHVLQTDIESVLRSDQVDFEFVESVDKKESPGHMKHHYMPPVPFIISQKADRKLDDLLKVIDTKLLELPAEIESVKILKPEGPLHRPEVLTLNSDPVIAAREFYAKLRTLANKGPDCIVFFKEDYHQGERWESLFDRMNKAASLIL